MLSAIRVKNAHVLIKVAMKNVPFLLRCMECRRGLAMRTVRPFICPSVRLSVKRVDCDKTETNLYRTKDRLA